MRMRSRGGASGDSLLAVGRHRPYVGGCRMQVRGER
jgi:hypothetical protein